MNAKGRAARDSRHVRFYHWMTKSKAWRTLDCVARCAYQELAERYNGSNNGRIPFSLREMARALNVGKATALRALQRLQERGFIVQTKAASFEMKVRHAPEWRLTEHACDATRAPPSRDFMRWGISTVSSQYPYETQDETVRVLPRNGATHALVATVASENP